MSLRELVAEMRTFKGLVKTRTGIVLFCFTGIVDSGKKKIYSLAGREL